MGDVLVNLHGEAHRDRRRLENRLFRRETFELYERERRTRQDIGGGNEAKKRVGLRRLPIRAQLRAKSPNRFAQDFKLRHRLPQFDRRSVDSDGALRLRIKRPVGLEFDVRSTQEFSQGALRHAVNMPIEAIAHVTDRIDKTKPVMLYCVSGTRARMVKQFLESLGFNYVYNLGGISRLAHC